MLGRLAELIRGLDRRGDGYSRALQAARVRAAYQRAYFAPALFNLIPVKTDMIASMAVDSRWRLYYNDDWLTGHTVEENAAVLIHEVSHLLRDHEARKHAAAVVNVTLWNTATDCEINDDLLAEGIGLSGSPWLIGIWRFRPFVRMVTCGAAALMTASPSATAKATANRIHRTDARVRHM